MRKTRDAQSGAPADGAMAIAPAPMKLKTPKNVTCPVCATSFRVRGNGGKCPVCGEQVVPTELAAANIPVASTAGKWLREGGWRVAAVLAFALYELTLFIILIVQYARMHAL